MRRINIERFYVEHSRNTDGDASETVGLYFPPQARPIAAGHWPPRETKPMPIFKENVAA